MYRVSHQYSAARVVLHNALPSMQISWRFASMAVTALLRLLGRVIVQGALEASYAVAQAAARVAPQPDLLVLPNEAAHIVSERAPAPVAQLPRGLLVLAHDLLGFHPAYARVTQRYQRIIGRH